MPRAQELDWFSPKDRLYVNKHQDPYLRNIIQEQEVSITWIQALCLSDLREKKMQKGKMIV